MEEIFLPRLHSFAMKNTFTGSLGNFRFRVVPSIQQRPENDKEVDVENSHMTAEFWHGPFCYEKSEIEGTQEFPLTEQGKADMKTWLESHM